MEVDSSFASLFQNLKSDDPWLPSKPWESIPSESGVSRAEPSTANSPHDPLYDPSTLSEVKLVRLIINALQGVESTLISIDKLSESFCISPSDRTSHRTPSLWYRSSSTNALGKILKSVGHTGLVALLLRKFVEFFQCANFDVDESSREEDTERKLVDPELSGSRTNGGNEVGKEHGYSLVNQAFSVAVRKVLEGYICALDTLYASVQVRRAQKKTDAFVHTSSGAGCLTSVGHSEITLLEVYLHTKELRTQIEALGNACLLNLAPFTTSTSSLKDLTTDAAVKFSNFPRGANLLTYLYTQLQDADPVHYELLKFLFVRSCEPYCGFIKSWIYQAEIDDPYKEFIVEYMDDYTPYSYSGAGFCLVPIKERDGVALPCFLKEFCVPLVRAGQQLQILIKLLELCRCLYPEDQNFEDVLPFWNGVSGNRLCNMPPLIFSKGDIDELMLMRESMYSSMQEKLQILLTSLNITLQQRSRNATPIGNVPLFVEDSSNTRFSSAFGIADNMVSPSAAEKGDLSLKAASLNSDASSAADELSNEESSECSSLDSGAEFNESEGPAEPRGHLIEVELSNLLASRSNGKVLPKPFQSETLDVLHSRFIDLHDKKPKLSHPSLFLKSGDAKQSCLPETRYIDHQSVVCWPLGGLPRNPFNVEGGCKDEKLFSLPDCSMETSKGGLPSFGEALDSEHLLPDQLEDIQFGSGTHLSSRSSFSPSWSLKYNCNILSMNPMVTKHAWFPMTDKSRNRSCIGNTESFIPYFDFSSVKDPSTRMLANLDQGFQGEIPACTKFVKRNEHAGEEGHDEEIIPVGGRLLSCSNSSLDVRSNQQEGNALGCASGGAKWENSLSYFGKNVAYSLGSSNQNSVVPFIIPLDVIIDKCILQEISLQYKYISSFTIKLLEEGFDLREHLLALRRYHFMEIADWADLFIMSLRQHNWNASEEHHRLSDIQGFLDIAVQHSSCQGDVHKERLFVYRKGYGMVPLPSSTYGVHAFDFIALGYKVDWPVSIILTPGSLKIYAEIFSFLIQVKLAVFSLTDMWCSLKDLVPLIGQNQNSALGEGDKKYFTILMRMRHQVNHFMSTLQQYVQSQLSHISWFKFLHSLKHQVKDILDLESVHMAYLADSLHICFLSDDTKQVASIIENILQCALDFRSCFTGDGWEVCSEQRESSMLLDRLNFSQVMNIKETFEKNLKELYLCYLKSPKHAEYGLCRFWGLLNYNDYYSNVIGKEISFFAL